MPSFYIRFRSGYTQNLNIIPKSTTYLYNELTEFEKRLEIDYQLQRAFDLVRGISLYNYKEK